MTKHLKGLSTKEVERQRLKFGYNEIKSVKEFTALKIFVSQFSSFLIIILIIAGITSIVLNETIDGIAILAIVIINAAIGFIQEYKAENAVKALKKMIIPTIIVIRNNEKIEIPIRKLVPNDIVILSEGDKVPADLEIIESFSLKVDESILTGESISKNKSSKTKNNILYKGTLITTGRATTIVKSIGAKTEFGKIINLVSKQKDTRSPLSKQLDQLGKKIALVVLVLVSILLIIGLIKDIELIEMLLISVALGVSAIPEGMPIIVTLTLAMGMQALSIKKAIVRKMNAIETLGATTIICSDKTGTLTLNEMTVVKVNCSFKETDIDGVGYSIKTKQKLNQNIDKKLLEICENCNNSFIGKQLLGDPTEIALKILNRKFNHVKEYEKLDEKTFSSERKMMSTVHMVGKTKEIFAKGAHEEILRLCSHIQIDGKIRKITKNDKDRIEELAINYSKNALRVLAMAYKKHNSQYDEKNLIFVGLVAMLDPPRKSVKNSIKLAQIAGIDIKIITGDNPITARAIGEKIGLKVTNILTGKQIDKLNNRELKKLIYKTNIFARTKPEHKYRIIDILEKNGEIVAATGDGVNDAPALKRSSVGIAMGIKGTEATKEVADIVLKDDNFSTIIETIKEGRRIYHNILAFIKYMLSANFDTIMAVGTLTILGFPLPILPLQILWINIATDSLPALALGRSQASKDIMTEKPHKQNENIFKKFFDFIVVAVVLQTISNLALYFYGLHQDTINHIITANLSIPSHARTLVFTEIVIFELLFVFVCKEEKSLTLKSLKSNTYLIYAVLISLVLQLIVIYVPFMQNIFNTVSLTLQEWLFIITFASTAFLVPSITNKLRKFYRK